MPIKVACACGKKLAVKEELAGKKVKCPACQKLLSIPMPKVQAESLDDESDLEDAAEEAFDAESDEAPARSHGVKKSDVRGSSSRKGSAKGNGKKSSGQNRGLILGLLAGGGVLVVALLTWLLWPAGMVVGQESLTLKGHTGSVMGVAFSPDGKRLVSASTLPDLTVKVWDATSGQVLLTLKRQTAALTTVAFSPDGKRLASGSFDKTVKMWDATNGQETLTLNGHTNFVLAVAFSPDGKRLASASLDQTVKVWDVTPRVE